jgi:Zn finger protein HypA/HybF involved in hydrogenase expression
MDFTKPFICKSCEKCWKAFDTDDITFPCPFCSHINNDISECRMSTWFN